MPKFLKPGKIVIVLRGRYAGRKAVIVRTFDDGTKNKKFGYAIVAGVDRSPLKVTNEMGKRKIAKRSRVKPFIKQINYNHLMPTRYALDLDFKATVTKNSFEKGKRKHTRKLVKKAFEEKYKSGKSKWFFSRLRF